MEILDEFDTTFDDEPKDRKFNRIKISDYVELNFLSGSYDSCQLKDVSLTGMFIKGNFKQNVGEKCLVKVFQKEDSSRLKLLAAANVVRKNDEGTAIKFTFMSFNNYTLLQTTLLYEAEEPLQIGLELPEECPFGISEQKLSILVA